MKDFFTWSMFHAVGLLLTILLFINTHRTNSEAAGDVGGLYFSRK
jgi:hypothetical protein